MDYNDINDIDSYIERLIEAQEQEINELYDNYYQGN
jgi:hypothetical protein